MFPVNSYSNALCGEDLILIDASNRGLAEEYPKTYVLFPAASPPQPSVQQVMKYAVPDLTAVGGKLCTTNVQNPYNALFGAQGRRLDLMPGNEFRPTGAVALEFQLSLAYIIKCSQRPELHIPQEMGN